MTAPSHIRLGKLALEHANLDMNTSIYKFLFLFGCIAPDINFIYPLHNIRCTPKRFIKRIDRMKHMKSKLVRSFTLGVIMHYLCDYFCIAHNNQSYGAKHTIYERIMSYTMKRNGFDINNLIEPVELLEIWQGAINQYNSGGNDSFDQVLQKIEKNSTELFNLVSEMNKKYIEYIKSHSVQNWYNSKLQMETDIKWALFMCEHMAKLVA